MLHFKYTYICTYIAMLHCLIDLLRHQMTYNAANWHSMTLNDTVQTYILKYMSIKLYIVNWHIVSQICCNIKRYKMLSNDIKWFKRSGLISWILKVKIWVRYIALEEGVGYIALAEGLAILPWWRVRWPAPNPRLSLLRFSDSFRLYWNLLNVIVDC